MEKRDYYEVLGVSRNATQDELKSAFRNLARQFHPDINKEHDAEEKFKEINEAYAVLSDDQKRGAYDRFGHAGVNGGGGVDFTNIDLSDILGDLFDFGFGFGRRGGGRRAANTPRRGADLRHSITLEFEEAVFGIDKDINYVRDEICARCEGKKAEPGTLVSQCPTCRGNGEVRQTRQSLFGQMVQVTTCPTCSGSGETIDTPCTQCRGSGLERKQRTRNVEIPGGVDNGTQIRITAEGQPGENGGPPGNLYLILKVKPHKYFKRRDNDVMLDLKVNVAQATLGAEVEVPTVDGPEKIDIPAGTQPGKVITLRGKGIPHLRGGGRGSQHVVVDIEIPKRLTDEERDLFEKLAEIMGTDVKPQERGFLDSLKDVFGL